MHPKAKLPPFKPTLPKASPMEETATRGYGLLVLAVLVVFGVVFGVIFAVVFAVFLVWVWGVVGFRGIVGVAGGDGLVLPLVVGDSLVRPLVLGLVFGLVDGLGLAVGVIMTSNSFRGGDSEGSEVGNGKGSNSRGLHG